MVKEALTQNTELDQHFLIDKSVLDKEIEISEITRKDKILEVGSGNGGLTKELVKHAKFVRSFEIDSSYKEDLDNIKGTNLEIIFGNALDYSWKEYDKIVSNIPYSVSEPLIMKVLDTKINLIVLIVGEKFKNVIEKNETKAGIITNLFFDVNFILKVDKKSFLPAPRVNSWLIKLIRKSNLNKVERVIQGIFKRKGKLKNTILYSLVEEGKTKKESRAIIDKLDLSNIELEKSNKLVSGKSILTLVNFLNSI